MKKNTVIALCLLALSPSIFAADLSLGGYLKQMEEGSPAYRSVSESIDAAKSLLNEKAVLTGAWGFADANTGVNKSPSQLSVLYGDTQAQTSLDLGVEGRTDFGLSGKLHFQNSYTSLSGITPIVIPPLPPLSFITMPNYYTSALAIEFKLDLLRNSFGSEVKAQSGALEDKNKADVFDRLYSKKQLRAETEKAYWKLSLAREAVKVNRELLGRSKKLSEWMQEKIDLNLMDKDDIVQADSDLKYRELSLVGAVDDEKAAARAFNALRGKNSAEVKETLSSPEEKALGPGKLPSEMPDRLDLMALKLKVSAAKAAGALKAEALKPELSVAGGASLNGQDPALGNSVSGSFSTNHYVYGVGVNLKVPFDLAVRDALVSGYQGEVRSAEAGLKQKELEAKIEWDELRRRLKEVNARLALANELEALQKKQADSEREKLKKGNTVTYQVILFEQDWGKSKLGVLSAREGLLEIASRLKLFGKEE